MIKFNPLHWLQLIDGTEYNQNCRKPYKRIGMKKSLIILMLSVSFWVPALQAGTIAYYRFGDDGSFLGDSSGSGTDVILYFQNLTVDGTLDHIEKIRFYSSGDGEDLFYLDNVKIIPLETE